MTGDIDWRWCGGQGDVGGSEGWVGGWGEKYQEGKRSGGNIINKN